MSNKRSNKDQLNQDNYNDDQEEEVSGSFLRANESKLSTRKIKEFKPRTKKTTPLYTFNKTASPFAKSQVTGNPFAALDETNNSTKTNTENNNSPNLNLSTGIDMIQPAAFSFVPMNNQPSTITSPKPIKNPFNFNMSQMPASPFPFKSLEPKLTLLKEPVKNKEDKENQIERVEARIKKLNHTFVMTLQSQLKKDDLVDLDPLFKTYTTYFKSITSSNKQVMDSDMEVESVNVEKQKNDTYMSDKNMVDQALSAISQTNSSGFGITKMQIEESINATPVKALNSFGFQTSSATPFNIGISTGTPNNQSSIPVSSLFGFQVANTQSPFQFGSSDSQKLNEQKLVNQSTPFQTSKESSGLTFEPSSTSTPTSNFEVVAESQRSESQLTFNLKATTPAKNTTPSSYAAPIPTTEMSSKAPFSFGAISSLPPTPFMPPQLPSQRAKFPFTSPKKDALIAFKSPEVKNKTVDLVDESVESVPLTFAKPIPNEDSSQLLFGKPSSNKFPSFTFGSGTPAKPVQQASGFTFGSVPFSAMNTPAKVEPGSTFGTLAKQSSGESLFGKSSVFGSVAKTDVSQFTMTPDKSKVSLPNVFLASAASKVVESVSKAPQLVKEVPIVSPFTLAAANGSSKENPFTFAASNLSANPNPISFGSASSESTAAKPTTSSLFSFGTAPLTSNANPMTFGNSSVVSSFGFNASSVPTTMQTAETRGDDEEETDQQKSERLAEANSTTKLQTILMQGESDEKVLFQVRGKVSKFVDGWKDVGLGVVFVNQMTTGKVRVLCRADSGGRVLLNILLFKEMQIKKETGGKMVSFGVFEEDKIVRYLVKIKTEQMADGLIEVMNSNK